MLADFIQKLEKGFQIVYGIRNRIKESFFLYIFGKLFYRIANLFSDYDFIVDMAEFSLFTNNVKQELLKTKTNFPFIRGELASVGYRRIGIKYYRQPRKFGKSKFKFFDLLFFAIGGLLSTSTFFLRGIAIFGLFITFVDFLLFILLINQFSFTSYHFAMIAIVHSIYFIVALSFISIYLARVHKNILDKPIFVIDYEKSFNFNQKK